MCSRHNFLLVKHGTGVTRRIHMVRGKEEFEAGSLEQTDPVEATNNTSLTIHPMMPFGVNTKTWSESDTFYLYYKMLLVIVRARYLR